jgi:hypothetical protein
VGATTGPSPPRAAPPNPSGHALITHAFKAQKTAPPNEESITISASAKANNLAQLAKTAFFDFIFHYLRFLSTIKNN